MLAPAHRAKAVCTQAGGEVRTNPDLISNGLSLIFYYVEEGIALS